MNLLKNELRKTLPYPTFWTIIGLFVVLLWFVLQAATSITVNGQKLGSQVFNYPDVWQKVAYAASYFNLLLGILVIINVTDEYSYRTLRQQIINGLSRLDFIKAKALLMCLLALLATIVVAVLSLVVGNMPAGISDASYITAQSGYLALYFLQACGYMGIALFTGLLLRKTGLAIIGYILYTKLIEPLFYLRLPDEVDQYFPMKVLGSLVPMPGGNFFQELISQTARLEPEQAIVPALVYLALFYLLSYALLRNRDL